MKKFIRAFSLVEVVITLGILGILIITLMNFFIGYNKSFGFVSAITSVNADASTVIIKTTEFIRQADQILTSRSFSGTTYTSNENALVISIPSLDSSGNIISNTYDYVVFYINSSGIYQIIDANSSSVRLSGTKKLSDSAISLTFTYNNADLTLADKVDVDIQSQKQMRDGTESSHLHQSVYLRNK